MAFETTTCPGCDSSFTLQGYQFHLALSWDPLCHTVFDKLKKKNDTYEYCTSSDAGAVPFQGGTFGLAEDYTLDTFGQDNNINDIDMQGANPDNMSPLLEVSDDEDELEDNNEEITNMVA